MEGLIKKFKKIVHEEKKSQKAQLSETQMNPQSTKEYFNTSQLSIHSNTKRNKANITKSFSESSLITSSFGRSYSQNKEELSSNDNNEKLHSNHFTPSSSTATATGTDSICKIISNTINYIQKNKDNCSLNKIVDNLNQLLEEHIRNMSNLRISNNKIDQQELFLRTKYETAEKMMKNFELKYLTAEKEKGKIGKQYDELIDKYNKLKEKSDIDNQKEDTIALLEKNNSVLIKTNDKLIQEIDNMKINEEKIKKSFDKEIEIIQEMLSLYKKNLNEIAETVYKKEEIQFE